MLSRLKRSDPKRLQLFEIVGRVDNENVTSLAQTLDEAIASGRNQLILDLSGVEYINSAGLRELVQIFKRLQRSGGTLTIVNPSEYVRAMLDLVGLDSVFEIHVDPLWDPARLTPNLPALPRQMVYCA
jgi:anti-sigma B factor antagonist